MIITIDGSSGTGKTTVAKQLAKSLKITFFDTGAMYRALAYFVLQQQIDPKNENELSKILSSFSFRIDSSENDKRYFVNDEEVTSLIRTPQATEASSIISAHKTVREHLLSFQREYGAQQDVVFEGRDLGTVVFPDADYKVYLYASAEIRAQRRLKELKEKNPLSSKEFTYDEILNAINERDHRDTTRAIAPLRCPEKALEIDTSHLSSEEVVDKIIAHIRGQK